MYDDKYYYSFTFITRRTDDFATILTICIVELCKPKIFMPKFRLNLEAYRKIKIHEMIVFIQKYYIF